MHLARVSALAFLITAASIVGVAGPAAAVTPTCGALVTESVVLTADLDCTAQPGPALRVGAAGITVDLGGHTVRSYGESGAVLNDGFDDVTIQNGFATGDTKAIVLSNGADNNHLTGLGGGSAGGAFVEVSDSTGAVVEGISDAGTINGHTVVLIRSSHSTVRSISTADGIELKSSSDNLVTGNQIGYSDVGAINVSGDRNQIRGNFVNGSSIHLAGPGAANVVANNTVRGAYDAIYVGEGMSGTVVSDNTVADSQDVGILVELGSTGTVVKNNTARNIVAYPNGDALSGTGIRLNASSVAVTGNQVYANAAWGIHSTYALTDGTGNIAYANAAGQCFHVACSAPDMVAPTVTTRSPAANAGSVAVSARVSATLSEPVQGLSGTTFVLKTAAGTSIPATVTYDATTRVATLDPTADLAPATRYTATLTGGPTAVRDLADNALFTSSWSFSTAGSGDVVAPAVTTKAPASAATAVAVGSSVTATFSEPVQAVTGTTFTVKSAAGTTVAATVSYNATSRVATLDPTANLASDTKYTATLTGGTSAIRDTAGNPLPSTTWTFTTGPAPTITTRTPASGVTGVSRTSNVTATFSEAVQGLTATTFKIKNTATGAAVSAVVSRNGTTNQWILNPGSTLTATTKYTITLTGGTTGIRDLANNPLSSNSWSFTTGA